MGGERGRPGSGAVIAGGEFFERAFGLAFLLHPDREVAFQVALEALGRLEVTARRQKRRRRYQPAGRRRAGGSQMPASRYKVALDDPQLLQLLVYIASEPHERRQEEAPPERRPSSEEMTVRFVAYLVRICSRRNAFHTALGVGRLLHDYSTEEVMAFYDLVVQDPDRYCAADYLRERKRVLLQQLRRRFTGLVETYRVARGEERFRPQEPSEDLAALVSRALEACTPWQSDCGVPEQFDPLAEELPALRFDGRDPDDEHPVEVRRIHALLHPPCLERMARSLEPEPPAERLTVPRFLAVRDGDGSGGDGDHGRPPELSGEDLTAAEGDLRRRAARRRHAARERLSVRVDGSEVRRWDVERQGRVRIEVAEEAERIEVWALERDDADVLLALFLPGQADDGSVQLEGKQSIEFRVESGSGEELAIAVSYREGRLHRAFSLWGRRLLRRFGALAGAGRSTTWRGALAGASAAVLLVAGGLLLLPADPAPRPVVRGPASPAGTTLAEVERIFVEPLGEAPFDTRLRSSLAAALEARSGWEVVVSAQQAQAVLRPAAHTATGAVTLQLVNRGGEILWEESFEGDPEEVAELAVGGLDTARDQAR